ncbi:MAG: hypothetical protein LBU18_07700 [Treponema sp.]|jgi:hypothetical protein|nr:hypothetical protein [Treponema sp.]
MRNRLPVVITEYRLLWFKICLFILFCVIGTSTAAGVEILNGRIKLVLHEDTGRFSLYYLIDMPQQRDINFWRYEPFFVTNDPRTSFLTVMINDRTYRLGDSPAFRMRIRQSATNPTIIFESSFLLVTQEFIFIKTAGSTMSTGVRMNVRLENRGPEIAAGLRFLLDTSLGEGSGTAPFTIGRELISTEFLIDSRRSDLYWVSRNSRFGLMGSIDAGEGSRPDTLHFANWKRLNEVPWVLAFTSGRNFNYLPYSINDSAVSYNFDPRPLARGASRNYTILLAAADENGFFRVEDTLSSAPPAGSREEDLIALRDLIGRLDSHLSGRQVLSDWELEEIETAIAALKARYGLR